MTELTALEQELRAASAALSKAGVRFALVGGLAASVRAEVRFTRDIDLAVAVSDDTEAEALVLALHGSGYRPVASVEHDTRGRLATVRLLAQSGIKVDLLFAASGIEQETVQRATVVRLPLVGEMAVARAEELLAMKILSMADRRLQDRLDAQHLLERGPGVDLGCVRDNLRLIATRGYDRGLDLEARLDSLLAEVGS